MNKVYQIVTDRIVAMIEEAVKNGDVLPWQKPWSVNETAVNYVTQKPYRGSNRYLLMGGEWITWNQICDEQKKDPKVHLKKGSKSSIVVYFNFKEKKIDEDETKMIPFLRYYNVFNISDVEGLESKREIVKFEHDPIEEAERIANSYVQREGVSLNYVVQDRAFYRPATDEVCVPPMEKFGKLAEFYSTLFHELTHSTGHPKRLNRPMGTTFFGSEDYSKEELVAEMGAAMLCGKCGIEGATNNSAAYLQNWMSAIKKDVTLIVSAAGKAQKAVDFIIGEDPQEA